MNSSDITHLFEEQAVRLHERDVDKLLTELRDELDVANANGKPFKSVTSISIPKTMDYFKCELRNSVLQSLKVSEVTSTANIAETYQDELTASTQNEYTLENLPLSLLQFYLQQIQELITCKRAYLLRWKQFARHTKAMESSYPRFQDRLVDVMNLWKNNVQRCERLSTIRETFITSSHGSGQPPQVTFGALANVHVDDVLIYIRWLVANQSRIRPVQKFYTVCQWIPHIYVNDLKRAASREHVVEGQSYHNEIPKIRRNSSLKSAFLTEVPGSTNASTRPNTASNSLRPGSGVPRNGASQWGPLSRILQTALPALGDNISASKHLLKYLADVYAIPVDRDIDQLTSTADFSELFVIIKNFFPSILQQQEESKTFKIFDSVEEKWEIDSPKKAFLLKANWQEFVHYKPVLDPGYETLLTYLRSETCVDELLHIQSGFLKLNNADLIAETYKTYIRYANETDYVPKAARVLSNKTEANTIALWRRIHINSETTGSGEKAVEIWDLDENRLENFGSRQLNKERTSFDVTSLLKLENKTDGDGNDPGSLCLALLRHLRIRDLQRTILSILNYFRSVERTIAIDSCGLISEEQSPIVVSSDEVLQPPLLLKPTNYTPKQAAVSIGLEAASVGLGQPHYIYNTPKDFSMSETEFMDIDDIANHANFYVHKDGRVHVKDEKGYYIMYDVALEDLNKLEEELLLLASRVLVKSYNAPTTPASNTNEEIVKFSNAPIDRLAVMFDFWTLEAEFQDLKRELFDIYYEAYLNAFSRDVRLRLIQCLVNIQHQRPKFAINDGTSPTAFIQIYRLECEILRKTVALTRDLFKAHIVHCRETISKLPYTELPQSDRAGLPFPVVLKQPVTVHLPQTAIASVDMLEFHQTLASIAQHLPGIISFVVDEFIRTAKIGNDVLKRLRVELFSIECLNKEWKDEHAIGSTFSNKIQSDILFGALADDPMYFSQLAKAKLSSLESEMIGLSRNDQASRIFSSLCRVLDIISFRQRLILALYESEVLARAYKGFTKSLGFEPYHLYLRCLHLENAIKREHLSFIVNVPQPGAPDEDFNASGLDKFVASAMPLAVQEVDENHIPHFSLRQPSALKAMLDDKEFSRLQATLTCQIAHKNLLAAAVQLMYYVQDHLPVPRGVIEIPEDPNKVKQAAETNAAYENMGKPAPAVVTQAVIYKPPESLPECFVSIQLEKLTKRFYAHNWFVDGKIQLGFAVKNPAEFEKLITNTVVEFSQMITHRASLLGLKAQLIAYYTDILTVLQEFPLIRDNFFQMGYYKEIKKREELTRDYLKDEPLQFKSRPRTVFSADGRFFMNLWFIPFPSEILQSFHTMADQDALPIFSVWLRIVAALHDMLLLMAAFAKLAVKTSPMPSPEKQKVLPAAAASCASAEWGGAEGIGAELFDIQTQIAAISDPSDAELVANFLELRRRAAFLQFDVTIRHLMRDALLPDRPDSYRGLVDGYFHYLPLLVGSFQRITTSALQGDLSLPEPLECRDKIAKIMFPHRVLLNRYGPFPTATACFHKIINWVHGCLCRLEKTDRQVLNGELMNLTLMTEEILKYARFGYANVLLSREPESDPYEFQAVTSGSSHPPGSRPASSTSATRQPSVTSIGTTIYAIPNVRQLESSLEVPPTKLNQPALAYNLVCVYLRLWKQMEVFKDHYMKSRVHAIDYRTGWTAETYEEALTIYCTERYTPMLVTVYNLFGSSELSLMLNFAKSSREILALPIPPTLSDLDCKAVQLAQLVQTTLCNAFDKIWKKLQRDFNLVLNEKAREEEDALPTDLWKKAGIRENFTITQPQLVELFTAELFGGIKERKDGLVVISSDSLNSALNALAAGSMARERYCFESYSSYYETLLRQYHRELYSKERELEALQSELALVRDNTNTMALEKMATTCRDLLLEVTSLRLRMNDAESKQQKRDEAVRLATKADFAGLVDALASASLQLRSRFDAYRHRIAGETDELIKETKEQIMTKIRELSGKAFDQPLGKDPMDARAELEAEVADLREQKRQLEALVSRMRAIDKWRITALTAKFNRQVEMLESEIDRIKLDNCDYRLLTDEEVLLLRQQQVTLRKAVSLAERETTRVRNQLDKEARIRQEHEQALREQMAAQEKSHQARTSTFERVVTDLAERNVAIRQLAVEFDSRERTTELDRHNTTRELRSARSQLARERDLKQQAIGRLGELARVVTDMETVITAQPGILTPPIVSNGGTQPSTRASTATVRQISSSMAVQFAATRPPSSPEDDQLDMTNDVITAYSAKPGTRPTTASATMMRAKRPDTASSTSNTAVSLIPKTAINDAQTNALIKKTRAKSARTDVVRFNLLSDLDPPTFDQIRQISRASSSTKVGESTQNSFG